MKESDARTLECVWIIFYCLSQSFSWRSLVAEVVFSVYVADVAVWEPVVRAKGERETFTQQRYEGHLRVSQDHTPTQARRTQTSFCTC